MKYRVDEDTIWEDLGRLAVHNYPASNMTYSYISKIYREHKKGIFGYKEVEGNPIYFHEMNAQQQALAISMATCEQGLYRSFGIEKGLKPIKDL